ncbi:enoyl-CoA hydratase/isomerase family protein [Nocardioides sp. AE5]|uniref:enoyl-CoA hydratase/isomerase family protein n=1 Tax=Nocardioides sp. AE5 TaxID=2962573 RepID=UPI0028821AEA|nr:enoyl-CoA hydratase/isomerase family protein [Nocardioides sp. AE5]MDT0203226.1 enoyl-CoA hydratase/isomerase family protein [Nocardioides sp. AE5]
MNASQPHLVVTRDNGVVTVAIDRPEKRNAIGLDTFAELEQAFRTIALSAEDRVVVLRGSEGVFSAGGELPRTVAGEPAPPSSTGTGMRNMRHLVGSAMLALHRTPQPIIAVVDGYAIGAGVSLALAADLTVATTRASFALPFVDRGLGPDSGLSWTLPRTVGLKKALELTLLGANLSAEQAAAIGLVNTVVEPAGLDSLLRDWTERLASLSPTALAATKQALHFAAASSFIEALDAEAQGQVISTRSGELER